MAQLVALARRRERRRWLLPAVAAVCALTMAPLAVASADSASAADGTSARFFAPSVAAPGGSGTVRAQEDPQSVWEEDFEQGQTTTPSKLGEYVAADGATYTSDPGWFDYNQCNGVIVNWASGQPLASSPWPTNAQPGAGMDWGVPSFPADMCNVGGYRAPDPTTGAEGNYPQLNVRRMADVLGQVAAGVEGGATVETSTNGSTAETQNNHAVTAWTQLSGGSGPRVVESLDPITLTTPPTQGAYYSARVDVVEASCAYAMARDANSKLRFDLLVNGQPQALSIDPIEACKSASSTFYTSPMPAPLREMADPASANAGLTNWGNGGAGLPAGRYFTDGSTWLTPADAADMKIRMSNDTLSGVQGNDSAFDNIHLLRSTPTLNAVFGATADATNAEQINIGDTTTLTFTIVNSTENAAKANWSFEHVLPAGLTVAPGTTQETTCTSPTDARSGAASITVSGQQISVNGSLAPAMSNCTVSLTVVAEAPGQHTVSSANTSVTSLEQTLPASVVVAAPATDPSQLSIDIAANLNWYEPAAGDTVTYTITVREKSPAGLGAPVSGAIVSADLAPTVTVTSWHCAAGAGSTCSPRGTGAISDTVTIARGSSVTYTVTGQIEAAGGEIVSSASVQTPAGAEDLSCTPSCSASVAVQSAAVTVHKFINGVEADTAADAPEVPAGSVMDITFTITNTGTIGLEDVLLTDDVIADLGADARIARLEPGAQVDVRTTLAAPQLGGVTHHNTATVTAVPALPRVVGTASRDRVSGADQAFAVTSMSPQIMLVTTLNGDNADDEPGVVVEPGAIMRVGYNVMNLGNSPLYDVVVAGDAAAELPSACRVATLAPGAMYRCGIDVLAPAANGAAYSTTATVSARTAPAETPTSRIVTSQNGAHAHTLAALDPTQSALSVALSVNDHDALTALVVAPGESLALAITVTNTGSSALRNIVVTRSGGGSCELALLSPGESAACAVAAVAPETVGTYAERVTVIAEDGEGVVRADASAPVTVAANPGPSTPAASDGSPLAATGSHTSVLVPLAGLLLIVAGVRLRARRA